jgi:hypothetical protein
MAHVIMRFYFFSDSKASASAKSLVLPDALLLRIRSSSEGMRTSIPSMFTGIEFRVEFTC